MEFAVLLQLGVEVAKLGASPAVQQLIQTFIAKQAGVSQSVVTAAVKAAVAEQLPDPKQ